MLTRALLGLIAAALIAFTARAARSLTTSGAIAATVIGTLAVAAGWNWGALLILYFVSSTALSRVGRAEKEERTASVVAKGGQRDAIQVFANGGVFAAAAIAMLATSRMRTAVRVTRERICSRARAIAGAASGTIGTRNRAGALDPPHHM